MEFAFHVECPFCRVFAKNGDHRRLFRLLTTRLAIRLWQRALIRSCMPDLQAKTLPSKFVGRSLLLESHIILQISFAGKLS
jgi:hypothetical protein